MLLLAGLCLAMASTIGANTVYMDGFTIEMPVWLEMTPRLQPPVLAPYKETVGSLNALSNEGTVPGRPPYQNRPTQVYYSQPSGYPNYVQVQPKPMNFPGVQPQPAKPQVFYNPPRTPGVYSRPTETVPREWRTPPTLSTTTTSAPTPRNEEDYGEEGEEESPLR